MTKQESPEILLKRAELKLVNLRRAQLKRDILELDRKERMKDLENLPIEQRRFAGMFPREALGEIFRERDGTAILQSKLFKIYIAGGGARLSTRKAGVNLQSSIEKFIENRVLVVTDSGNDKLLSLTPKGRRRFKIED